VEAVVFGGTLCKSGIATLSRCRAGGGAWHSLLTIPLPMGADFDGMARRMPDAPRYVAHFFASPRTGNAAYSGCASRHREFEGFMMIIA
jgi:hypothetical protein